VYLENNEDHAVSKKILWYLKNTSQNLINLLNFNENYINIKRVYIMGTIIVLSTIKNKFDILNEQYDLNKFS
jgi:hypothetical protein